MAHTMQKEKMNQRKIEAKAKIDIEQEKLIFSARNIRTKQIISLDIKGVEEEVDAIVYELEQRGITDYNNIDPNGAEGIRVAKLRRKQRQHILHIQEKKHAEQ